MSRGAQRGAAVVMAMLVVAITATLVAGAHWQQNLVLRQVENEYSFAQAKWLLRGAIDWAGAILEEDARLSGVDHLGEPWATPLADTHLNEGDEDDPVYLSGQMRDEQGKFNLRNLVGPQGVSARELAVFRRLLALVGAEESIAHVVAARVLDGAGRDARRAQTALGLVSIDDLSEVEGVGSALIERLRPFVTVLPQPTPVNANTAPAVVLAARFENLALADAQRLAASRDRAHFKDRADILGRITQLGLQASDEEIAVGTRFFSVEGTVSYRRARLRTRALLWRDSGRSATLWLREAA